MAVTLTVGTNSYVDVATAEGYLNERLYAEAWTNADSDTCAKALIMATKKIDRQPLRGQKVDPKQILKFPRAIYSDDTRKWVPETEVAQCVKDAVCEEALALLMGIPKRVELQNQGVKSVTISKVTETYKGSTVKLLSQEARELIQHYLAGSVAIC